MNATFSQDDLDEIVTQKTLAEKDRGLVGLTMTTFLRMSLVRRTIVHLHGSFVQTRAAEAKWHRRCYL